MLIAALREDWLFQEYHMGRCGAYTNKFYHNGNKKCGSQQHFRVKYEAHK